MASKEELKRQIAALQARLADVPESPPAKRRRQTEANVLAPATPSPRKKKTVRERSRSPTDARRRNALPMPPVPSLNGVHRTKPLTNSGLKHLTTAPISAPSSFISQLKSLNANTSDNEEPVVRTEGFEQKPAPPTSAAGTVNRDDRLAVIEDLVPGPTEHKPIEGDPSFERLEPNSGIRLKERTLSHSSLQDHLTGRYFLPPSLLYSVVRLESHKQAYEVPVEGDWVTIAVVAERGDVKFTTGPGNATHKKGPENDGDDDFDKQTDKEKSKKRKKEKVEDEDNPRRGGKKYALLKLVDLGHRSRNSISSSNSPRGSLRGDAQLSLLLFESDYYDRLIERNGKKEKVQKLWRGGSGGAFEECFSKLREGTVIALLNPKVLKPFTNNKNPSSQMSSILALTPPSASAIAVIGHAADLGRCTVLRRDGKPCGSWVDRRISQTGTSSKHSEDVCEYHVQATVQRTRASRAEFSIGTTGLSNTAHKRKSGYYPARQWGLKPEGGSRGPDGEVTYVVGGLVASSSRGPAIGNVGESMGREEQARARRKAGAQNDKVLSELLGKGKSRSEGGAGVGASKEALVVVQRARKALSEAKERNAHDSKAVAKDKTTTSEGEDDDNNQTRRKGFSAEMIKCLGFDPTAKAYRTSMTGMKPKTIDTTSKLGKLADQNREIRLGPPPGPKVRSAVNVTHLSTKRASATEPVFDEQKSDIDDRTVEEIGPGHPSNPLDRYSEKADVKASSRLKSTAKDDSDSDLEIEPPPRESETEILENDLEYI